MTYTCPICGTEIEAEKHLEYCVCGGKYTHHVMDFIEDLFKEKNNESRNTKNG